MSTTMQESTLDALRASLQGMAYEPHEAGYAEACQTWNLSTRHQPAVVVVAEGAADVIEAVRFVRAEGLGVGVMATGHGTGIPCDGGVLINTSRMNGVTIDPVKQTATVEAGARWTDVMPLAHAHGLAGLVGSSSGVGVVGFTMGGGMGWLGRKYGLNAGQVKRAEIVTADGERLSVSAEEHPDLFWGLAGAGGNFGIVTALEFGLVPVAHVYGGNRFYPVERAPQVLELYAAWSADLPDEMTTGIAFLNVPPLPDLPEPLRGKSVIAMRAVYCGEPLATGRALMRPWDELGAPILDTFGVMPYTAMDSISMDPVDPIPAVEYSDLLRDLSPEARTALIATAGAGSHSPLIMLELRQLGGALAPADSRLFSLGCGEARFIMNGVGLAMTPEMTVAVKDHLARVSEATRPYQTGETYLNFLELEYASADRVRAAYRPADWDRLVALKDRHDPENRFRFNRNIPPTAG